MANKTISELNTATLSDSLVMVVEGAAATEKTTVASLKEYVGSSFATVATTGSYADLTNKPTIPAAQIQADWDQSDTNALDYIKNKPTIPSGVIVDQIYDPTSTNAQSGTAVAEAVSVALGSTYKAAGSVAFANLGALTSANEGKVYNVTDAFTTTSDFVEGAGESYPAGTNVVIINVGTSQSSSYKYDVLAGFVDLSGYATTASLATVATSGSYADLSNKPTIPAAQVQADWNETNTSSMAYIANKPTIPAGVIVDQVYDGTSANAQSGVAIAGAGFLTSHQDISGKQDVSNLVTSLSASSTDTQYPSAKCVYDLIGDIETALAAI